MNAEIGERRVALVTGGASGIGRAAALALARAGHDLVIADRQEDLGAEVVGELRGLSVGAEFAATDVTSAADVQRAVELAKSRFGRLDAAVNAAGIDGAAAFTHDYDESEFERVLEINLKGVWLSMKHEIPAMIESGGGAIVNISSGAAVVGVPTMPAYVSSKAGVIGLSRTAAVEYAREGVRVNAITPGVIQTPMLEKLIAESAEETEAAAAVTPMQRVGEAREVADVAAFLCSDGASYVTGAVIAVDGGLRAK